MTKKDMKGGSILNSITDAISSASRSAIVSAEHVALKAALFDIPSDEQIDYLQKWFRYFGITPSISNTAMEVVLVPIVIVAIIAFIYQRVIVELGNLKMVAMDNWEWSLIIIIFLLAIWTIYPGTIPWIFVWIYTKIASIFYWLYTNIVPPSTQAFLASPVATTEGFAERSSLKEIQTDPERMTLVNIQPASVKQIGYTGPQEKMGKFQPDLAIMGAVRAGVRFFTLQIDYLENTVNSNFDKVNFPTLLYRNDSNEIVCTNGASIADIAKNLAIYAFNTDFPSSRQPLILYLHFVRTPDYITKPDAYMNFLANVAEALGPIQKYIVKSNENTDFTRQQNERALLYTPLTIFENKILLFTNADTTVFRNAAKLSMTPVPLNKDLDYMACMRVYLDDNNDNLGITGSASEQSPYAVVASYDRLNGMSKRDKESFAMRGKTRFVIAMPTMMQKVSQTDIQTMFTTMAVNTVPMNLFGGTDTEIKSNIISWNGKPFYNLKPALLQSTKVAVAGYTPPPTI
jgi:hypothetical protein